MQNAYVYVSYVVLIVCNRQDINTQPYLRPETLYKEQRSPILYPTWGHAAHCSHGCPHASYLTFLDASLVPSQLNPYYKRTFLLPHLHLSISPSLHLCLPRGVGTTITNIITAPPTVSLPDTLPLPDILPSTSPLFIAYQAVATHHIMLVEKPL